MCEREQCECREQPLTVEDFPVGTHVRLKAAPDRTAVVIRRLGSRPAHSDMVRLEIIGRALSTLRFPEELEIVEPSWDDVKVGNKITYKRHSNGRRHESDVLGVSPDGDGEGGLALWLRDHRTGPGRPDAYTLYVGSGERRVTFDLLTVEKGTATR